MAQSLRRLESRWLVDFRKGHRELFAADLTNPMWDKMVPDPRYRCLIPVTAFAQPEGPSGRMTRTWFRVRDWPVFAWAGFCRRTEEWGRSMPP